MSNDETTRCGVSTFSISASEALDMWVEVELFRWQYGEMPRRGDTRRVDIAAALEGVANGLSTGDVEVPSSSNLVLVMRWLAGHVRRLRPSTKEESLLEVMEMCAESLNPDTFEEMRKVVAELVGTRRDLSKDFMEKAVW